LAPRYYGQRAVFASLRALFSLELYANCVLIMRPFYTVHSLDNENAPICSTVKCDFSAAWEQSCPDALPERSMTLSVLKLSRNVPEWYYATSLNAGMLFRHFLPIQLFFLRTFEKISGYKTENVAARCNFRTQNTPKCVCSRAFTPEAYSDPQTP